MAEGLHTCCIRKPKRIGTNFLIRSFSNFDAVQHPNRAFSDKDSFLNSDQSAVLHNIPSVVGFYLGHPLAMGDSGTSTVLTRVSPCDYDLFAKVKEHCKEPDTTQGMNLIHAI